MENGRAEGYNYGSGLEENRDGGSVRGTLNRRDAMLSKAGVPYK